MGLRRRNNDTGLLVVHETRREALGRDSETPRPRHRAALPTSTASGSRLGAYELVEHVQTGDTVYHWHATEHRFVGKSQVASAPKVIDNERVVALDGFELFERNVDLGSVRKIEPRLRAIRDELQDRFPGETLYLPFQYRKDGLRMVNYYFAKLPHAVVEALFEPSRVVRRL